MNRLSNLLVSFLLFLLAWTLSFPPKLAAEEKSSSGDNLFETEEEVKSEEWKKQVEKQLKEAPLRPEEYVVSGSKYAQSLREAPSLMTVLSEDDIRAYGITSLAELFRLIPGVSVKAITPFDERLWIRGLNFLDANMVLVLINGCEINSNLFGGIFWSLFPISLEDIERIEVIRGPGSALYGSNAFSGVINITTKNPREARRAEVTTQAGFSGSDFNTLTARGSLAQSFKKLSLRATGDYDDTRSFIASEEKKARVGRASFRSVYEWSGQTILDADGGMVRGDTHNYSWVGNIPMREVEIYYAGARFQTGPLRFHTNIRSHSGRFWINTPLLPPPLLDILFPEFKGNMLNLTSRIEVAGFVGRRNRLTSGIEYLANRFDSDILAETPQWEHRIGLYAQDEFRPFESLILYLGARYDYNSASAQQEIAGSGVKGDLSPRVSVVYLPHPRHSLRASFGRAFRKPSFFEYGMEVKAMEDLAPLLGEFLYAPDLENEHINVYQLDYQGQLHRRLEASVSVFFNQYWDKIYWAPDATRYYTIPGEFAENSGGEVAFDLLLPYSIRGFLNYSYLKTKPIYRPAEIRLDFYPEHHVNAGFQWVPPKGPLFVLLFHWMSSYRDVIINPANSSFLTGFSYLEQNLGNLLVNLKASYRFLGNRIEAGVKVFNLLDDNNHQHPGVEWTHGQTTENFGGEPLVRTTIGFVEASF